MAKDKTPTATAPMAENHANMPPTMSHDHTAQHGISNTAQPLEQPPQYKTAEAPAHPQAGHHHHPHTGSAFPPQQGPQNMGGGGAPGQPMMMGQGAMYQQELMAQCARGNHSYDTKVSRFSAEDYLVGARTDHNLCLAAYHQYGVVGIIVAVCCFPIGLVALCCDRKEVCTR